MLRPWEPPVIPEYFQWQPLQREGSRIFPSLAELEVESACDLSIPRSVSQVKTCSTDSSVPPIQPRSTQSDGTKVTLFDEWAFSPPMTMGVVVLRLA